MFLLSWGLNKQPNAGGHWVSEQYFFKNLKN